MSITMDEEIKRWTAKRKSALVMEIIQGKTTVAEAARAFDLPPSEIEEWVDDAKRGMENALRAKPLDIREQYEKQLKELQEDGIVLRVDFNENPPKVEYSLTKLGISMVTIMKAIRQWGAFHLLTDQGGKVDCLECDECKTKLYGC